MYICIISARHVLNCSNKSVAIVFGFAVGSVLIFVTRKANSVELQTNLKGRDFKGEIILCLKSHHMLRTRPSQ